MLKNNSHYVLVEAGVLTQDEFDLLTEEQKDISISSVLKDVLTKMTEKVNDFDLLRIDDTRGNIFSLESIETVNLALKALYNVYEKEYTDSNLKGVLVEIENAIRNLNKFAPEFKDAYKNKKTILIMQYRAIVTSLMLTLTYVASVVTYNKLRGSKSLDLQLKNFSPAKALSQFNSNIKLGNFQKYIKDLNTLREEVEEVDLEKYMFLETYNYGTMLIDGLKNFANKYSPNLVDILYKSSGILVFLLSIREIVYMLSKTSLNLKGMTDFLNKVSSFLLGKGSDEIKEVERESRRNIIDAETSNSMAEREIKRDNVAIAGTIKKMTDTVKNEKEDASEIFDGAGFFNF